MPDPLPTLPELMPRKPVLLAAVQPQPACVETESVALLLPLAADALVGLMLYVQLGGGPAG